MIDAGGKAWLTQSRPITTLYPLPEDASGGEAGTDAAAGTDTARVPVRHAAPGAHAPHHADGPLSPGPHEGKQGAVEIREPRAADVRRPDAVRPQQIRPPDAAADASAGGRKVRGRVSRRSWKTRGSALCGVPGRSGAGSGAGTALRAPRRQNDRARTAPRTSAWLHGSSRRWCVPCCGRTRNCAGHGAIKGASKPGWHSRSRPVRQAAPARGGRPRDHCQRADPGHTAGAGCRVPDAGRRPQAAARHCQAAGTGGGPAGASPQRDHRLWTLNCGTWPFPWAGIPRPAGCSWNSAPRNWLRATTREACRPLPRPGCGSSCPSTATGPWRKSTWGCRGGPRSRTTSLA